MSWRLKRQTMYVLGVVAFIATLLFSYIFFSAPELSCTDQKQNQGELGVDCGGPCSAVCRSEVTEMVPLWARALPLGGGLYDLVAFVENPNPYVSAPRVDYHFEVFDAENQLLLERRGTTFARQNERFLILDPRLEIARPPRQVFVELSIPEWKRHKEREQSSLTVKNEQLILTPKPHLSASLVSKALFDLRDVVAQAVIYTSEDNAIAVSETVITSLPSGETRDMFFTWPEPFTEAPQVCTTPVDVALLFDRSGSMNNDGGDPPQPITSAKEAAITFVDHLGSTDRVSLISFGTHATYPIDQTLTTNYDRVKNAISSIIITPEEESGSTNIGDALMRAREEFKSTRHNSEARKVSILLTDGRATFPNILEGEKAAVLEAENARAENIESFAIGLGTAVNESFLKGSIASKSENYYHSATAEELSGIYTEVARSICPEKTYLTKIFIRASDVTR